MNIKWAGIVALSIAACGGKPSTVTRTVGAVGGTLGTSDGSSVSIPSGAVMNEITVSMTPEPNVAAPAGTSVVGSGYLFGPEGATFTQPVAVVLAVDTSKIPAGKTINDVSIYTAPAGSTSYERLATSVVDTTHVRATTTHFSIFVPAVIAGGGNVDMGSGGCTVTCTEMSGSCACSASCGGRAYTMQCFDLEGCQCTVDGIMEHFASAAPRCSQLAGLQTIWTTSGANGCGFPGTFDAAQ
jgi:hypothetical protein